MVKFPRLTREEHKELRLAVQDLEAARERFDPFYPKMTLSESLVRKVDPTTPPGRNGAVTVALDRCSVTAFDVLYAVGQAKIRWLRFFSEELWGDFWDA